MLEAAGLLEDALREYSELEACYLEAVQVGCRAWLRPASGRCRRAACLARLECPELEARCLEAAQVGAGTLPAPGLTPQGTFGWGMRLLAHHPTAVRASSLPLQSGQQARPPFGCKPAGEDEAALLWAPWGAARAAAAQPDPPPEFAMRQALFASQARLLFKLHRHAEVRGCRATPGHAGPGVLGISCLL